MMTTMATLTLAEFLLARIDEDEAFARRALQDWAWEDETGLFHDDADWVVDAPGAVWSSHGRFPVAGPPPGHMWFTGDHLARWDPARVLAECDAKRRVMDAALDDAEDRDGEWGAGRGANRERILVWQLLALPYADHPDYLKDWRP
jgi:hypothetical protein